MLKENAKSLLGLQGARARGAASLEAPDSTGIAAFHSVLRRERALAHRLNYRFSLLVLEPHLHGTAAEPLEALARAFRHRVREIDVVGWLAETRLAVIMPQTSPDNAMRVACEVCRSCGYPCAARICHVAEYPGDEEHLAATPPSIGDTPPTGHPPAGVNEVDHILSGDIPWWKRGIDIVVASLALLVFSPVMAFEALLVKTVSPGPCLFRQTRIGHLGKPFVCLKFRTMHVDNAQETHRQHLADLIRNDKRLTKLDAAFDPRIIPFGRTLRASGLDELPQLINILRGEMSLVGPRPCIAYEYEHFAPWQRRRCETPPGITGLWQVNGKNRTTFRQMMCFDISYVQKRSLALDVATLLRTPVSVVGQMVDSVTPRPANAAHDRHGPGRGPGSRRRG